MIEGLKIELKSEELVALFRKQADACRSKIDKIEMKLSALKSQVPDGKPLEIDDDDQGGLMTEIGDMRGRIRQQIRNLMHRSSALAQAVESLELIASHVIPKEVYRLDVLDLARMARGGIGGAVLDPGPY